MWKQYNVDTIEEKSSFLYSLLLKMVLHSIEQTQ